MFGCRNIFSFTIYKNFESNKNFKLYKWQFHKRRYKPSKFLPTCIYKINEGHIFPFDIRYNTTYNTFSGKFRFRRQKYLRMYTASRNRVWDTPTCAPDAPRGRHGGRGRTGMRVFGLFDVLQGVQGADRPCAAGVCESTVKKQKGEGTPWDALVLFRLKGNSRKRF